MSDETPPLPKRPYKKKEPKRTPEEIEQESLLLTTVEKAIALLLCEQETPDYEAIAVRCHTTIDEVIKVVDSAPMKIFLRKLQDREIAEVARLKVRKFRKLGINRGAIEERLMELANLDPSETKGNIEGQVKALAALADKFGYSQKEDPLEGKSPDELKAMVVKGHKLIEGNTSVN